MKKFFITLFCLIGVIVVGGGIGVSVYAHNKGYDNAIEWVKDTKLFKDDETVVDDTAIEDTEEETETIASDSSETDTSSDVE